MPIFAVSPQKVLLLIAYTGVSGPNATKIVHNVEKFILYNLLKFELRYCNPFPNGSETKEICPGTTPVFRR